MSVVAVMPISRHKRTSCCLLRRLGKPSATSASAVTAGATLMPSRTFDQVVLAQFSLLFVQHAIRLLPRPANVSIMQNSVKIPLAPLP